MSLVTIMAFLPALTALIILCLRNDQETLIKRLSALAAGASFLIAAHLFYHYDYQTGGYQFEQISAWVPSLGINFHVGIDGINAALILLHACCSLAGVLVSFFSIKDRFKEYFILYLMLISGVYGVFVSLDMFAFYFFYETAVVPMFLLIGIWGTPAGRWSKEYAMMKLTLYITCGAVIGLVGLLSIYALSGAQTFDLVELERHLASSPLPRAAQLWIFPMLLFGFGVLAKIWPTHSWSPIGYAAAPPPVSMLHAGVLMKLGAFAIIRFAIGLLPGAADVWMPVLATLCVCNVIYAGYVAMTQRDAKFILGFSSTSHMGYILLGLATMTPLGLNGAVFMMFAHGVMAALGFALVGFIYSQTHTRMVDEWGGLAKRMPFIGFAFVAMAMASSGLPGFANFVSELLVLLGAWDVYRVQTCIVVFGIVITAVYMLRMTRTGLYGELPKRWEGLRDASTFTQRAPFLLLMAALLVFGCYPQPMLKRIDSGTTALLQRSVVTPGAIAGATRSDNTLSDAAPLSIGQIESHIVQEISTRHE